MVKKESVSQKSVQKNRVKGALRGSSERGIKPGSPRKGPVFKTQKGKEAAGNWNRGTTGAIGSYYQKL